jgi:hypothetical protein
MRIKGCCSSIFRLCRRGFASANISKATLILFLKTVSEGAQSTFQRPTVPGRNRESTAIIPRLRERRLPVATAAVQSWITSPVSNNGLIIAPADGILRRLN